MDEDNEQPRPLHIVKQASLDTAGRPPSDNFSDGHRSGGRLPHRTSSLVSEESMESISEESGGRERPLAIPKKRRSMLARRGTGAGRFDTPVVAAASAATRRRMNATDNFGSGFSDEEDDVDRNTDEMYGGIADHGTPADSRDYNRTSLESRQRGVPGHSGAAGLRRGVGEAANPYGSIRSRFQQQDARADAGYGMESAPPQRPRSTVGSLHGRYSERDREDSMHLPGRAPEDDGPSGGYQYARSVYGTGNEAGYRESVPRFDDTSVPLDWNPDAAKPPSFRQQPSITSYSSRTAHGRLPEIPGYRHDSSSSLSSPPLRHHSYERPVSAAPLPADMGLFPPDPYERAATAVPFDGRHAYQRSQVLSHASHRPGSPESAYGHPQPASFDPFDRRHPSRPSLPFAPPAPSEPDPQILIPIVSVTPERRTVVGDVNSFWAAIELFAQVTAPLDTIASRSRALADGVRHASTTSISSKDDQDLYRYGYLSDMNIEIHPSPHSEILEVIGKSPSILTLFPGSRRLMIVHVHLNVTPGRSGHAPTGFRPLSQREKSEKLMEDLELQLGATAREYMQVQLTYNHSGFPKFGIGRNLSGRSGGCVAVQTTIETTATAVIMQQNTSSVWSPSPSPANSPLVDIVGKHWGPAAALEMAQRLAASNEMRMLRKSANPLGTWMPSATRDDPEGRGDKETRPSTPEAKAEKKDHDDVTPRAGPQRMQWSGASQEHTQQEKLQEKPETELKQQQQEGSRKAEHKQSLPGRMAASVRSRAAEMVDIRRVSSTTGRRGSSCQQEAPLMHIQRLPSSPASEMPSSMSLDLDFGNEHSPPPGCLPTRIKSTGPRQAIPNAAPRNIKRPVGTDTTNLQRLAHRVSDLTLGSENMGERDRLPSYSRMRNSSRSSMASKKSGKWSWTGWFS